MNYIENINNEADKFADSFNENKSFISLAHRTGALSLNTRLYWYNTFKGLFYKMYMSEPKDTKEGKEFDKLFEELKPVK